MRCRVHCLVPRPIRPIDDCLDCGRFHLTPNEFDQHDSACPLSETEIDATGCHRRWGHNLDHQPTGPKSGNRVGVTARCVVDQKGTKGSQRRYSSTRFLWWSVMESHP